jgi:DNA mismatch repair ATPase MutS
MPLDMDEIAAYWRSRTSPESIPGSIPESIDDRTWRDLDCDALFTFIDTTSCAAGKQLLYAMLREPSRDAELLAGRDAAITAIANDGSLRQRIKSALKQTGDLSGVYRLFGDSLPERPRFAGLVPFLSVFAAVAIAAAFITPAAVIAIIAIAVINFAIQLGYRRKIQEFIPAVAVLRALLGAAEKLSLGVGAAGPAARAGDQIAALRAALPRLTPLRRSTSWLFIEQSSTNEITNMVAMYVNMFFLLDVNAFVASITTIRNERAALESLFRAIGTLDAYGAAADLRSRLPKAARPRIAAKMNVLGAVHPLLDEPVPNDVIVERGGLLITGSNMSGKTTFLRTVAVNVILAQTLCVAAADDYAAPLLAVRSAIGGGDSLLEGKSYYLRQVEDVRELVLASDRDVAHLFILDELFRGTNTVERIAAGKAILAYLARSPHVVLAATHDLELIELLGERYEFHHFAETIEDGALSFDFKLRPGAASTRNAIRLLEVAGFPASIVEDALRTASHATPATLPRR